MEDRTHADHGTDTHQIRAVLEHYSKSWEAMDWEGLKSIWDPDYAHILYIPEERAEPLRGWAEVETYFRHAAESVIRVGAMQLSDISIDVLAIRPTLLQFPF